MIMVHSLQTEGTNVVPGRCLNGVGGGQSAKFILPSIISISTLLSLP